MRALTNAKRTPSLSFGAVRGTSPHASSLRKTPALPELAVPAKLRWIVLRQSDAVVQPSHHIYRNVSAGTIKCPCSSVGPLATARRSCASDHVREHGPLVTSLHGQIQTTIYTVAIWSDEFVNRLFVQYRCCKSAMYPALFEEFRKHSPSG